MPSKKASPCHLFGLQGDAFLYSAVRQKDSHSFCLPLHGIQESHKDLRHLCTSCAALGGQGGGGPAVEELHHVGPLNRDTRPLADLVSILESRQVCGLGSVVALIGGVAVQNDRQLLAGDGVFGAELRFTVPTEAQATALA